MKIEYKDTSVKERSMDQHSQALLDLYESVIKIADDNASELKLARWIEHPKSDGTKSRKVNTANRFQTSRNEIYNQKWQNATCKMFRYMYNHFPKPNTCGDINWEVQLRECGEKVFGGYINEEPENKIVQGEDIWVVPPLISYALLPIIILRNAFKDEKMPMARATGLRRGKIYRPWAETFVPVYAEIIMAA